MFTFHSRPTSFFGRSRNAASSHIKGWKVCFEYLGIFCKSWSPAATLKAWILFIRLFRILAWAVGLTTVSFNSKCSSNHMNFLPFPALQQFSKQNASLKLFHSPGALVSNREVCRFHIWSNVVCQFAVRCRIEYNKIVQKYFLCKYAPENERAQILLRISSKCLSSYMSTAIPRWKHRFSSDHRS